MKMKSVLAAVAAVMTVSALSVCGSAETAGNIETEGVTPATEADETAGNPDTGVEGVAAVTGGIVLAGALVAISRKKERE